MSDRDPLDPRLVFYLEHKGQIDEWLKLPDLERQVADSFFRSVVSDLDERLPECSGNPDVYQNLESRWRKLLAFRSEWASPDTDDPLIGMGFEWGNKAGFDHGYVGIRISMGRGKSMEALRQHVIAEVSNLDLGHGWKRGPYWPFYKHVIPANPNYWEDLDAFCEQVIEAHVALWETTWEAADRAFRGWTAESASSP